MKKKKTEGSASGILAGSSEEAVSLALYKTTKVGKIEHVTFKMPRVVPDQRSKFENEEFFRKLSRECEVNFIRPSGGNKVNILSRDEVHESQLSRAEPWRTFIRFNQSFFKPGRILHRESVPSTVSVTLLLPDCGINCIWY